MLDPSEFWAPSFPCTSTEKEKNGSLVNKQHFLQHRLVKGAWSSIFKTTKQKHCQKANTPPHTHAEERIHQENDRPHYRHEQKTPASLCCCSLTSRRPGTWTQVLSLKVTPHWCSCCWRLSSFCCSRWSCCGWWRSRSFVRTSAPSDRQRWLRWAPPERGAPRRTSGRCWWGSENTYPYSNES